MSMAWFIKTSKQYMAYGTPSMPKARFWMKFPWAAAKFYWYTLRDALK